MTDRQIQLAAFIARAFVALLFFIAGLRKLFGYGATLAYFTSLGMPWPALAVPVAIVVELGGGLAFLFGWRLRIVAPVLAIFTVATALAAHRFWEADGPQYAAQLNNFFKNITIAGSFALVALMAPRQRKG